MTYFDSAYWTAHSGTPAGGGGAAGTQTIGISNLGNTSGTSGVATGSAVRIVLAGGDNVTLSQSLNAGSATITISAGAGAQSAQTLGLYASSQTTGAASSSTADARSVTMVGAGAISVGLSAGSIIISGAAGAQSAQSLGIYASSQTTGQSSSSTADARSLTIVGAGAVSAGLSGGSIILSAPNTVAQTAQSVGLYALSQTTGESSSSTADARSISVVARGGLSAGLSGGSLILSAPAPVAQSVQSVGLYAVGQTTGESSSTTRDARSISVDGAGLVSVGYSGGTLRISATAPAQTVESQSAGMSNIGNTAGTSGLASGGQLRLVLVGSNNITLSQSVTDGSATVSIIGGAGVAQSVQTIGVYASSQTTGESSSTTIDARSLTFVGQGNVSVGASAGSILISASGGGGQSVQTIGLYAAGSTFGESSSTTRDARSITVHGSGAVNVGYSAGSLRISAPAQQYLSRYVHNSAALVLPAVSSQGQNASASVNHIQLVEWVSMTRAEMLFSVSVSSSAASNTAANRQSWFWGLYTRNGETLNPLTAGSSSATISWASSTAGFAVLTGPRVYTFPIATALSPGDYYFVAQVSTSTFSSVGAANTTNLALTLSPICGSSMTATHYGYAGSATADSIGPVHPLQGMQSVVMTNVAQTLQQSNISGAVAVGNRANNVLIFRAA
jgi:hypothetical protein